MILVDNNLRIDLSKANSYAEADFDARFAIAPQKPS